MADAYGLLRKTNKAQLFKELEKNVLISERHLTNVSDIYNDMAKLQKLKLPAGATYRLMAEKVFSAVTNNTSRRIVLSLIPIQKFPSKMPKDQNEVPVVKV